MSDKQREKKGMDNTTLILAVVALALLVTAYLRGRELPLAGITLAGRTLWRNLPLLLLGFLAAGLIQVIIPREVISRWLGAEAGTKGVLIGCLAGGLIPGSPYTIFPLIGGIYRAGAGLGAVVGFITAWSLWSVTRLPLEIALIDPKAALTRYAVTFVVPPLAGLVTQAAMRWL